MPGEREEELKRRLASVLWDAVEECVQRLDAESVNEKVRRRLISAVGANFLTLTFMKSLPLKKCQLEKNIRYSIQTFSPRCF